MRRTHVIINNPTFRVSALSAIYSLLASRLLRLIVLTVAPASSRLYALVDFSSRWRNEMSGRQLGSIMVRTKCLTDQ